MIKKRQAEQPVLPDLFLKDEKGSTILINEMPAAAIGLVDFDFKDGGMYQIGFHQLYSYVGKVLTVDSPFTDCIIYDDWEVLEDGIRRTMEGRYETEEMTDEQFDDLCGQILDDYKRHTEECVIFYLS